MTPPTPAYECEVTVTLCFGFCKMTPEGYPVLRDKLNDRLFVLTPYNDKEEKDAARQEEGE